ncbi:MAG TPA: hypothetical protein VKU60_06045, partial [Chloroflexota bacterium]|nr:hypothetical protein [Chloroflexota bacterium]
MKPLCRIGLFVVLVLLPHVSSGQVVASIRHICPEPPEHNQQPQNFILKPGSSEWVAVDKIPVDLELKTGLKTGPKGWMAIWYENRKQDELGNNSEVQLSKGYGGYVLKKGTILATSPADCTAGQAQARAEHTAFVMTYDPDTDTVEVVGVSGRTEVRNVAVGGQVVVEAHQLSRVEPGRPATEPRRLEDTEYGRYLRAFEQGGAEGRVDDNPLVTGASVPAPPAPAAPAGIPGEETERERAGRPADYFKQPFPAATGTDL